MFIYYIFLVVKIWLLILFHRVTIQLYNILSWISPFMPFNPLVIFWGLLKNSLYLINIQATTPRGLDNWTIKLWTCNTFGSGPWSINLQELHFCTQFIYCFLSSSWFQYWTYSTTLAYYVYYLPILIHWSQICWQLFIWYLQLAGVTFPQHAGCIQIINSILGFERHKMLVWKGHHLQTSFDCQ